MYSTAQFFLDIKNIKKIKKANTGERVRITYITNNGLIYKKSVLKSDATFYSYSVKTFIDFVDDY